MAIRPRSPCRSAIRCTEALLLWVVASISFSATVPAPADAQPVTVDARASTVDSIAALDTAATGIAGEELYLDVTLNGAAKGLVHFTARDGKLYASVATLKRIGIVVPGQLHDPVQLDTLPGMRIDLDVPRQSVTMVAPLALLDLPTTSLNAPASARPRATVSPGVLVNYTFYGTSGNDGTSVSAYSELRAFGAAGTFSTTGLAQTASETGSDGQAPPHFVRLDTNWTMSFPERLLTLLAGDTLTDSLAWTRSTRIGGLQIGTNYALQPYLLTAPLPSFFGSATLPSSVELYVNGVRQYSGHTPAGPFQLNALPSIDGVGNARVVLTDALGQVTTLNFAMYGERELLRAGLTAWSAELGFVRENYGLQSFDYGHEPVASGTWRRGFDDRFTAEAHVEATRGLADVGAGGNWLIGDAGGVASASLARSGGSGAGGTQYGLGYRWTDGRYSVSASGIRTQGNYRDIGSLYDSPTPQVSAQVSAGYASARFGTFGAGYVHLQQAGQPTSRYATASWSRTVARDVSLDVNFNQNVGRSGDRAVSLAATIALDHNVTVNAGAVRENGRTSAFAAASAPVPSQGGFGWRAALNAGSGANGGQAELDYLGRYGQATVGAYAIGATHYGYASASGSLVAMGGDVFAARHVASGFAVVSTSGVPGVPVLLENNRVGVTDGRGLLLVTPLNAYQGNHIGIDPMNLPADMRIDAVTASVTPTDRAGTMVDFRLEKVRAAVLTLVDEAGRLLPLGSRVRIEGHRGEPATIGFDGAVYLDTLEQRDVLDVDTPNGRCVVRFDYPGHATGIPQIGPLVCQVETR